MGDAPPPRRPLWRIRLIFLAILAAFALGASELILRVRNLDRKAPVAESWVEYDELLGWHNKRSFELLAQPARIPWVMKPFTIRFNASGVRADRELGPVDPAVTRIACVGDSFTLGVSIEADATWPRRLGTLLGPSCETWNWGVGGYGIDQCLIQLERDVLPTRPAVVVFAFMQDDWQRALFAATATGDRKPWFELDGDELALRGTPCPRLEAGQAYYRNADRTGGSFVAWRLRKAWRDARRAFAADPESLNPKYALGRAILTRAIADCRKAGAKVLFVLLASKPELDPPGDPLERYLPTYGLDTDSSAYLDLFPAVRAHHGAHPSDPLFLADHHPDETCYDLFAREIAEALRKKGFVRTAAAPGR